MADKLQWFRWFPSEAEADEGYSLMTDTELGFFHRCLNKAWVNNGLPADDKELARLMRVSDSQFKKLWAVVGKRFSAGANGRLTNGRMEEERARAQTKSKRATESVRVRYDRKQNEALRASVSSSSSKDLKELPRSENWQRDAEFQRFREMYISVGGADIASDWPKAFHVWRLLDFEHKQRAIDAVKGADPAWLKLPQNYLSDREYDRPRRAEPKSKLQMTMEQI